MCTNSYTTQEQYRSKTRFKYFFSINVYIKLYYYIIHFQRTNNIYYYFIVLFGIMYITYFDEIFEYIYLALPTYVIEGRGMTMSHDIVIWPSDMSDEPSDKTMYLAEISHKYKPAVGKVYLVYIYEYMLTMVLRGFADKLTVSRAKQRFYVYFLVDGA